MGLNRTECSIEGVSSNVELLEPDAFSSVELIHTSVNISGANYFFPSFSYNLCAFKFFTFHLHILQMLGFVTTLKKTVSLDNTVGVNLKLEILLTLLAITMNCLILMMTEQSKGVVK